VRSSIYLINKIANKKPSRNERVFVELIDAANTVIINSIGPGDRSL